MLKVKITTQADYTVLRLHFARDGGALHEGGRNA